MKQIYNILSTATKKYSLSWWFDFFIISLISLNVLALVLESVKPIKEQFESFFYFFELSSVAVFTVEYILRVITINYEKKYSKPLIGNLRFILTPMAVIDLLAVLPFYLPFVGIDLRFLRILRLFRLFRLFKIARYVRALNLMDKVVKDKREELTISIILIFFLLLMSSSVMYYIENEAQPDNFSSIPQTMWWGIATLTTVGYGDVYPVTGIGKLMGSIIAVLGVGLFALPTGILASGFSEELSKSKKKKRCPHCNGEIEV